MPLSLGSRLGPYEVISPLGAGGMGVVYLARDRKLDREVAIKVLPEGLARDEGARARFEREARAVAALSHPNILAIYDFGDHEGVSYAVTELLSGQTLRESLFAAPLPLRKAIDYAVQIARGLAAAHSKGIVHRDLKPENVFVTADGGVKILDFGLSKQLSFTEGGDGKTSTVSLETEPGTVLGTVGYMSPEQVRGHPADTRSDVFSFGTVLYEMLAGARAFRGTSTVETMSAILSLEPPPLVGNIEGVSAGLDQVVRRCLEKSPSDRFQSVQDLGFALEAVSGLPGATRSFGSSGKRSLSGRVVAVAATIAIIAAIAAIAAIAIHNRTAPRSHVPWSAKRYNIDLPEGEPRHVDDALAVSADGTRVAFHILSGPAAPIFVRALDQLDPVAVRGTEGGGLPFFSPDGQWLGFFAEGKLKKVSIQGGEPITLSDAPSLRGGAWGPDGTIVFAPRWFGGLFKIPASGGTPEALTQLDATRKEMSHRWPAFLPGGRTVLFNSATLSLREEERGIFIVPTAGGKPRQLLKMGLCPRYLSTGHLVFGSGGLLATASFDFGLLQVTGPVVPVLENVRMIPKFTGHACYSLSDTGTLVYVPGSARPPDRELVWVDRQGHQEPLTDRVRPFASPALSPDGGRLAVTIEGPSNSIWILDLGRKTWQRLTLEGEGDSDNPIWSPDGVRIIFSSNRDGASNLYSVPSDGSGSAEKLTDLRLPSVNPHSVSRDGTRVAFRVQSTATGRDIWILPLSGAKTPRPFLATPTEETSAQFSPDGRYIAYTSFEGGNASYVRPSSGAPERVRVSSEGGFEAVWAKSGRELFYRDGDKLMAVPMSTDTEVRVGTPKLLFSVSFAPSDRDAPSYDVTADGKRFVIVKTLGKDTSAPRQIVLVPDWKDELEERRKQGR